MSGLITVEDYNSALLNYDDIIEVVVDGSKFPEGETHFMYDFLEIRRGNSSVVVTNKSSLTKVGGATNLYSVNPSEVKAPYLFTTHSSNVQFFNDVRKETEEVLFKGFLNQPKIIIFRDTFRYNSQNTYYPLAYLKKGGAYLTYARPTNIVQKGDYYYHIFEIGEVELENPIVYTRMGISQQNLNNAFYFKEFKNPNFVNITGNLFIGKKDNTLTIEPFMIGTEESPVKCKIKYLRTEQTFTLSESNTIKVDLREYSKTTPLTLTVELSEGPYTNKETLTYEVPVTYQTVNTQTQLLNELTNLEGTQILRLGANITLPYNNRIPILHDAIIIGNNKTLKLNHSSLVIQEGKTLKIQDTTLSDGDNAIIQKDNSILEAHNCSFINNTSRNNEGLGSCVYCDIDLDSLTVPNDFTTIIDNCTFKDCHGAILHGGELTVTNTTYTLTDSSRMNTHSPYFLYQTDGEVTLTGNTFDVDIIENVYTCETLLSNGSVTRYDTNAELINTIKTCRKYLSESDDEAVINDITDIPGVIEDIHYCEAQENANLAQCLFVLGETATINDKSANELQNPNNINLTHNNSHIFMKYYYPEIGACVYISPMSGYETKNLCYNISGTDWIYKYNTQITRADAGAENTDNPLRRNQ